MQTKGRLSAINHKVYGCHCDRGIESIIVQKKSKSVSLNSFNASRTDLFREDVLDRLLGGFRVLTRLDVFIDAN